MRHECAIPLPDRTSSDSRLPERTVAELAARQYGVISLAQLTEAGISAYGVARRVRSGRLHRVHRGVYAVGHPSLGKEGRWLAAVRACGEGAALSHRSAAALWGLLPVPGGPVDIAVQGSGGRRRRSGIAVHRSSTLTPACSTCHRGIPVTTPARTINDLRRVLPLDRFEAAIRRAEVLRLDVGEQGRLEPDLARSELERAFRRLCRRHRLPEPEANALVGPFEVDFLWRDRALIVEADGFRYHGTRSAFEADRARDARLASLGYQVVRFTHRQVTTEPEAVAATLRALLGARQRRVRA
jgi:very-short-patch-repair endonuclease